MVSNFHQVLSKERGLAEDEALPLSSSSDLLLWTNYRLHLYIFIHADWVHRGCGGLMQEALQELFHGGNIFSCLCGCSTMRQLILDVTSNIAVSCNDSVCL